LTTSDDIHVLFVFDPAATEGTIASILQIARVPEDGTPNASLMAGSSLGDILTSPGLPDCICIPAHIDDTDAKGLLRLSERQIEKILCSDKVFCVEWRGAWGGGVWSFANVDNADGVRKQFSTVRGSDCHRLRAASDASCWVKLQDLTLESLKMALLDGRDNIRDGSGPRPSAPPCWLKSIEITGGRFAGRPDTLDLRFNPALNCLIGGRGAGKSTVIECLREVLSRASDQDMLGDERIIFRHRRLLDSLATDSADRPLVGFGIAAVFHSQGRDFRIVSQGHPATLELEVLQDDEWVPTDSAGIRDRFPMQVFSQNQIINMAETTETLFKEFAPRVPLKKLLQQPRSQHLQDEFLRACLARESIRKKLAEKSEIEARLGDVRRRIETMEKAGFAAVLREFQIREIQASEIGHWEEFFSDWDEKITAFQEALDIPPLSLRRSAEADPAADAMEALAGELRSAAHEASGTFQRLVAAPLLAAIQRWKSSGGNRLVWETRLAGARAAYDDLASAAADEHGEVSANTYGHLVQQKQILENSLRELERLRSQERDEAAKARQFLHGLLKHQRGVTNERRHFIADHIPTAIGLKMEVLPYQCGWSGGEEQLRKNIVASLRELLGKEDRFDSDFSALADFAYPEAKPHSGAEILRRIQLLKRGLRRLGDGRLPPDSFPPLTTIFVKNVLVGLRVEARARLATWWPEDGLRVRYQRDDGSLEDIQNSSPGQKTAAVLAFLLSQGDAPLVIDQPEDDLDNRLIYGLVVGGIRNNKRRRQLIVATHNANIVVNGNAELVIPLRFRKGQINAGAQGSTQRPDTREAICDILEGGREAFRQRYRKIITA
jgi:energy-coupling factor transporter ATP-binding protein EcfA2